MAKFNSKKFEKFLNYFGYKTGFEIKRNKDGSGVVFVFSKPIQKTIIPKLTTEVSRFASALVKAGKAIQNFGWHFCPRCKAHSNSDFSFCPTCASPKKSRLVKIKEKE